jgi:hypothetical protein
MVSVINHSIYSVFRRFNGFGISKISGYVPPASQWSTGVLAEELAAYKLQEKRENYVGCSVNICTLILLPES